MIPFIRSKIFRRINGAVLHSKTVACSVYSKNRKLYGSKDFTLQKQTLADVCKVDVLKDFAKLTGKTCTGVSV